MLELCGPAITHDLGCTFHFCPLEIMQGTVSISLRPDPDSSLLTDKDFQQGGPDYKGSLSSHTGHLNYFCSVCCSFTYAISAGGQGCAKKLDDWVVASVQIILPGQSCLKG